MPIVILNDDGSLEPVKGPGSRLSSETALRVGLPMAGEALGRIPPPPVGNVTGPLGAGGGAAVAELLLGQGGGAALREGAEAAGASALIPFAAGRTLGRIPALRNLVQGSSTVGRAMSTAQRGARISDDIATLEPDQLDDVIRSALRGKNQRFVNLAEKARQQAHRAVDEKSVVHTRDLREALQGIAENSLSVEERRMARELLPLVSRDDTLTILQTNRLRSNLDALAGGATRTADVPRAMIAAKNVKNAIDDVLIESVGDPKAISALRRARALSSARLSLFGSTGKGNANLGQFVIDNPSSVVGWVMKPSTKPGDVRSLMRALNGRQGLEAKQAIRTAVLKNLRATPLNTISRNVRRNSQFRGRMTALFGDQFVKNLRRGIPGSRIGQVVAVPVRNRLTSGMTGAALGSLALANPQAAAGGLGALLGGGALAGAVATPGGRRASLSALAQGGAQVLDERLSQSGLTPRQFLSREAERRGGR